MKNKIVKTRHELHWHIINDYLTSISAICVAKQDKTFNTLLNNLQNYVYKQLAFKTKGDIVETYVVVLQLPDE